MQLSAWPPPAAGDGARWDDSRYPEQVSITSDNGILALIRRDAPTRGTKDYQKPNGRSTLPLA
jgi:hypothetical protein